MNILFLKLQFSIAAMHSIAMLLDLFSDAPIDENLGQVCLEITIILWFKYQLADIQPVRYGWQRQHQH